MNVECEGVVNAVWRTCGRAQRPGAPSVACALGRWVPDVLGYTSAMSPFTYEYARPAFTCDTVVVSGARPSRMVLLIRRGEAPFGGLWAVPGGFVDEGESPERAARRELAEETGLALDGDLIPVGTFGNPGRDPRGWTVTAVYAALAPSPPPAVSGGDDASEAAWFAEDALPLPLAFDHGEVVSAALARLDVEPASR